MHAVARCEPQLDEWIDDPALRVRHRRESTASADDLWRAAREVSLSDTALLGRLVRWRIPGLARDATYDGLFREPPFVVLEEGERMLVSGSPAGSGRCAATTPGCARPTSSASGRSAAPPGSLFAHWAQQIDERRAALASEVRVQPIGAQGRIGLAAVRPLVRSFQQLVGSDGISAAVRRAERGDAATAASRTRRAARDRTAAEGDARCASSATIATGASPRGSNVSEMDASFDGVVTVRFIRYANDATGWAVLDAVGADGAPVVLVGPLVHLEQGERAHVVGTGSMTAATARRSRSLEARPLPPDDPERADRLPAARQARRRQAGAGARRRATGAASVLDAIDDDPQRAFAARRAARRAALEEAVESWQTIRVTRRLHLLLAPHGLAYLATRIHDQYGADAPDRSSVANPYELTSVFGVGFLIADRIAHATGPGDPSRDRQRERAAILHALSEAERSGSTCLPLAELLAGCAPSCSATTRPRRP